MQVRDELASAEGLDVNRVRGVIQAIIFHDDRHILESVLPEQERPEGAIGYRVLLSNPGGFLKESYVSIGREELRIVHTPEKVIQYIRVDYVIPHR